MRGARARFICVQCNNIMPTSRLAPHRLPKYLTVSIFQTKGLPTDSTWPGVHKIPDFIAGDWPKSEGDPIEKLGPRLCKDGVDMLDRLLKVRNSIVNLKL